MNDIPTFTTAKAFNDASKEADWGYEIVRDGDQWKLINADGGFVCSAAKEHWVILFGKMLVDIDERVSD